jgi:heat shock protein HslJ
MKKSKLFILGIALLTVFMISCHNKRNKLVNSWKITAVEPKMPLSDSAKTAILTNGTLTFTEDGHVTGYLQREITDGTYALTKKGKSLVIKDETGTPFPCESTITDDQLILDSKEMKLTLKKI